MPRPYVTLVVGVNGVGKTTTIAKLAAYYQRLGHDVMLAAGDTFRAAAIDQLEDLGRAVGRAGDRATQQGADPGAVVFDAHAAAAHTRNADVLIVDTAGRLHTKTNLMAELKQDPPHHASKHVADAPQEVLLVHRRHHRPERPACRPSEFAEAVDITGIVHRQARRHGQGRHRLRHRAASSASRSRYIGTGEKARPTSPSSTPETYVDALFFGDGKARTTAPSLARNAHVRDHSPTSCKSKRFGRHRRARAG